MANIKCAIIDRGKLSESEAQIYVNAAVSKGIYYFLYKDPVSFADGIKTFKNRLSISDVVEWIEVISHGSVSSLDNFIIGSNSFYVLAKNLNELKSRFSQNTKIYLSGCNTGRTKSSQDRCIADLLSQEVPCSILGTVGWIEGSITQNPADVKTTCEKTISGMIYRLGQGDCLEETGDKCWKPYEKERSLFSANKISTILIYYSGFYRVFVPSQLTEIKNLIYETIHVNKNKVRISDFRANPDMELTYHYHGYSTEEFGLYFDIPIILYKRQYFLIKKKNSDKMTEIVKSILNR